MHCSVNHLSFVLLNLVIILEKIDNLIILSSGMDQDGEGAMIDNLLEKFRHLVNPNLLFVSVDLKGRFCG